MLLRARAAGCHREPSCCAGNLTDQGKAERTADMDAGDSPQPTLKNDPAVEGAADPATQVVPISIEDVRVGYQTAVTLWTYEGTLIWSKYNAMLVANSVVLAATGFSLGSTRFGAFAVTLPLACLVFCLFWWHLTKRGFDNYIYWVLSARELEEKYIPGIQTISRGGAFADGAEVTLEIGGKSVSRRMSPASRSLRAATSSYGVIYCFAVVYVILFGSIIFG
jgi:hypothetical protein